MTSAKSNLAAHPQISSLAHYQSLYQQSIAQPEIFWKEQAKSLAWFIPPKETYDADLSQGEVSWFVGGKTNACFNCVDRHVKRTPQKPAIIWVGNETNQYKTITFAELAAHVSRMAQVLRAHGIKKGDRVCIYLPMIPELAYAMLACARIGAIHSVVFAGFSAPALKSRIIDADCRVVITANEGVRGPKRIALKQIVDNAIGDVSTVDTVLVVQRTETEVPMLEGRDFWLAEELEKQRAICSIEWMDSEDPLFILYTSGSTGKPKGLLHTTAGYLLYAAVTHKYIFAVQDNDIHFCAADAGWITGHSYIIYGPLANGTTTVIFESIPTYPDAGRYWQIVDDINATSLYTAPTAIRTLMRAGDAWVHKYKRDSLRILGSVGEPINPEVWRWYHDVVGKGQCAVVDTWWQTETGGILISPLPGITPCKPGSATLPFFGIQPVILDDEGRILEEDNVSGNLCIAGAWPGQARTIYGDHRRFQRTYFERFSGYYFTGDGCRRDEDGYYWITGRIDDVINVSGHRLGTAEVESALVAHSWVAEAAVVGVSHALKGTGIYAFVVMKGDGMTQGITKIDEALKKKVREMIGFIATLDQIQVVSGLPKTRSGKIMRRILRTIAAGDTHDLGDTSTLAEPKIVDELIAGRINACVREPS